MNLLRTIHCFAYMYGYMLGHLSILHKAEKALASGDLATVDAITSVHVPHWCAGILKRAGVTMEITGQENIPAGRACVFVSNHRSYADIPVMLLCLDGPHGLLAKAEIDKLPLIRRWMRLIGCVFVDRSDVHASMRALNTATETVAAGRSFTIFPEGTRCKGEEGDIGEFKGGAFRIATKCGAPLVPVVLLNTRHVFEGSGNRLTPTHVIVKILPVIETAGLDRAAQKALPQTVQAEIGREVKALAAKANA